MLDIDKNHEDTQALPWAIYGLIQHEIHLTNMNFYHMHESPYLVVTEFLFRKGSRDIHCHQKIFMF